MRDPGGRRALVPAVLADAPQVHEGAAAAGSPFGDVWATDRECYEFLADRCAPDTRTLETGLGVSTVLFAAWGCRHTCVVPFPEEVRRCREHCAARGIDDSNTTYELGASAEVLPSLTGELDVVFVDGCHGYPAPILDWYYAAGRLGRGGVVVFDDVQLPHVSRTILSYLAEDPRWVPLERTWKWAAFRRESEGPLVEEWFDQPFLAEDG